MKNFVIGVCLLSFTLVPVKTFSQDSTAVSKDSAVALQDSTIVLQNTASADSLVKCRVCGFMNKSTNTNCEACGASLAAGKMSDSTLPAPVDTMVEKIKPVKSGASVGIKLYVPMEKEVFVAGGNPFPMAYGFGAHLNVEYINKLGNGGGLDIGYYEASNITNIGLYDYLGNVYYFKIEFGYKGVKIHPYYKWKDQKIPFWTSIGCPIWFGKTFVDFVEYDEPEAYSSISVAGIGGDFFVGTDIDINNVIFLTPQAGIQLMSAKITDPDYEMKTSLLSIQMMLGISFRLPNQPGK